MLVSIKTLCKFGNCFVLFLLGFCWARSYFISDTLERLIDSESGEFANLKRCVLCSQCGGIAFGLQIRSTNLQKEKADGWEPRSYSKWEKEVSKGMEYPGTYFHLHNSISPIEHILFKCGFAYSYVLDPNNSQYWRTLTFPYWLIASVFSIFPIRSLVQTAMVRRRKKNGSCINCGYDLRSGHVKCPECGIEIPVSK